VVNLSSAQWRNEARKKQEGESDLEQKQKVARIMRTHFGKYCIFHDLSLAIHKEERWYARVLTESQYHSGLFYTHKPDLIVPDSSPLIVIEIDGDVHWQNTKSVRNTNERNEHYEFAGFRFIWLTSREVDNSDELLAYILGEKLSKYGIKPTPMKDKAYKKYSLKSL